MISLFGNRTEPSPEQRKLSKIGTQFIRSTADELSVVGNDLYFAASDGIHGKELFSYALSPTGEVMGDANGDAQVDFADFLILSSEFGKTMPQNSMDADFDDDGRVNFSDFLLLSSNFNKPGR